MSSENCREEPKRRTLPRRGAQPVPGVRTLRHRALHFVYRSATDEAA
ncbi:hypothetical protein Tmar_0087 [Thermaerobacter marianensis DSM 12885]|uniref:Uncharacterized protein n=1 Tax=Thermaerobacter marianensis (strain ATCC 700841 / DSM 12885 / JCM 10246 / 7p75a) TaxID=644966 RepID=E6SL10_THEM7|nr:hypothetical protein Tmar_0087 [Thermaerobacter marianensis DSM 12885]